MLHGRLLIVVCVGYVFAVPIQQESDETHQGAGFINTAGAPSPFIWKQCSPPDGPMRIGNLTVVPSPIVLSKTKDKTISVGVEGSLGAAVDLGSSVDLIIKKRIPYTATYERVPCVDQWGSCSYPDLCAQLKFHMPVCNDWFERHGLSCHCPFAPQTVSAAESIYTVPAVGKLLPGWLADGDFQVQVTLKDAADCLFAQFSLALVP
eukprot:CAMPEP_0172183934 /NCGR_PEP_ID=MMETSP1050-20130122/19283_1 /TAXON_ID=233186 /ORGANISM="Cryptomonas curvata, Strain CCAP979/52" /LENGTH=205 /DNA_ID=CAMNT_0012857651 /DNA_START=9 /DNA_END=626 /DNA_ORIENTATION=+